MIQLSRRASDFQQNDVPPLARKLYQITEWAFVAGLVVYLLSILRISLSIPWYYNSDEVVFTAEIIKFLQLNFNQNFFDIPGTPFMAIAAVLWAGWYHLLALIGQVPDGYDITRFSFEHLESLYGLMRLLVIFFFGLSIILTYLCGKRLINTLGGCIAAALLGFFPTYLNYSTFVRTESLGLCLSLVALYLLIDALEQDRPRLLLWSGLLSGIATATRFHFALATLPIFILFCCLNREENQAVKAVPNQWLMRLLALGGIGFVLGGGIVILLQLGLMPANPLTDLMLVTPEKESVLKAVGVMRKLWLILAAGSGISLIGWQLGWSRRWVQSYIRTDLALICLGFALGLVLGTPTFLWRGEQLLQSIQLYGNWIDYDRAKLSPLAQFIDLYSGYWMGLTQNRGTGILLGLGTLLVLIRRERKLYPILLGAALTFISQPILLPVAHHRPIPWLPYLSMIQAYPLALGYQLIAQRSRDKWIYSFASFSSVLLIILVLLGTSFPTGSAAQQTEAIVRNNVLPRLEVVEQSTTWLENNTPPNSEIFVSFYAFNRPVFYTWMEGLGAAVPESVKGSRKYIPWWGTRPELSGRSGYIVVTNDDIAGQSKSDPRDWIDSSDLQTLKKVKAFEEGYQMNIFQFDFRKEQT